MFKALYEISQLLNSIREPEKLLEKVMDIAIESVDAERGFIVLIEGSGDLRVVVARQIDGPIDRELSELSRTAFKDMLEKKEPKTFIDAQNIFPEAESIMLKGIKSIACVPLLIKDRLIGGIYVDTRTERQVFDEDKMQFLVAFANIAALAIDNARLCHSLIVENINLKANLQRWQEFPEIVSRSERMKRVYELMNQVIPTDVTVLICGETGTGKELIARAIHYNGYRKHKPFITVNCSAIPESLLESELFGYKKGSFTGATSDRPGIFKAADGGTIFLDEVSDLPLSLQPKILRVLQEGEIRRLGETKISKVDVRIISATNQNLEALVRHGRFREDLYYRLNVVVIPVPPLRERLDDIPLLVDHFIKKYSKRFNKSISGISKKALNCLYRYNWPGNVRELENVIERAVVLCRDELIDEQDLDLNQQKSTDYTSADKTLAEIEKEVILERLKRFSGNRKKAAESLGISLRKIQYKLAQWREDEKNR